MSLKSSCHAAWRTLGCSRQLGRRACQLWIRQKGNATQTQKGLSSECSRAAFHLPSVCDCDCESGGFFFPFESFFSFRSWWGVQVVIPPRYPGSAEHKISLTSSYLYRFYLADPPCPYFWWRVASVWLFILQPLCIDKTQYSKNAVCSIAHYCRKSISVSRLSLKCIYCFHVTADIPSSHVTCVMLWITWPCFMTSFLIWIQAPRSHPWSVVTLQIHPLLILGTASIRMSEFFRPLAETLRGF